MSRNPKKVALARRLADDLMRLEGALAVLLVGSVATGLDSPDSDLDLAVVMEGPDSVGVEHQQHEGILVGIERYPAEGFLQLPRVPFQDLKSLRSSGRFARGLVLASRWSALGEVQRHWQRALLHPSHAKRLIETADRTLVLADAPDRSSRTDRIWNLQGGASSLAIFALTLAPCRFQKPKWVMHDLKAFASAGLLKAVQSAFLLCQPDLERMAKGALEATAESLQQGCRLAGMPPLSFDPSQHDLDAMYVHGTFLDAQSLFRDGDFEGSAFTATYTLRLMNSLMQRSIKEQADLDREQLQGWRKRAFQSLYWQGLPGRNWVRNQVTNLQALAIELRENYCQAALEDGTELTPKQISAVRQMSGLGARAKS